MRKTKIVTIEGDPAKNRDAGKRYLLTEMPALQAELWGYQVMQAVAANGVDIGDISTLPKGVAAVPLVVGMGLIKGIGRIPFSVARPLLDEMMGCVKVMRDDNPLNAQAINPAIDGQIEEWSTPITLRRELIELHTGFSIADVMSPLISAIQSAGSEEEPNSSNTPTTSPPQSGASSPAA